MHGLRSSFDAPKSHACQFVAIKLLVRRGNALMEIRQSSGSVLWSVRQALRNWAISKTLPLEAS